MTEEEKKQLLERIEKRANEVVDENGICHLRTSSDSQKSSLDNTHLMAGKQLMNIWHAVRKQIPLLLNQSQNQQMQKTSLSKLHSGSDYQRSEPELYDGRKKFD